jgi:uncharacterized protein
MSYNLLFLSDEGYGKAYFPLSMIFKLGQGVVIDEQTAIQYAQLAFEWCFDNQLQDDPEIWSDLGMMYRGGEVVKTNYNLAFFWFKKAAKKKQCASQFLFRFDVPIWQRNRKGH